MRGENEYPMTRFDVESLITVHRDYAYRWRNSEIYRDATLTAKWDSDARSVQRFVQERCAVHDRLAREYLWELIDGRGSEQVAG